MVGAGPFATGPTALATIGTIFAATDRARLHATIGTDNLLAGRTLAHTVVTRDMTVAVERDLGRLAAACMAVGMVERARIAVTRDLDRRLALAVAEGDLRTGDGRADECIGIEHNLHAQPVIFHLLGNLAL
jgi:hypothetical protein